jgi:hypothetical protein
MLSERFEDFRKANRRDSLKSEELAGFGPVQIFRSAFLAGWYTLLAEISRACIFSLVSEDMPVHRSPR